VASDKPIRAILDVVGVPYQAYKLPADSRQWVQVCHERRAVVVELATHANADGSSIYASVATMAARVGIAERTFRYRLDDLGENGLGFVSNGTQRGVKGGRNRKLNVEAILKAAKTLLDSKAQPCKSEESNLAPLDKPCTTGSETLQESQPNPAQVAANPAPYRVQPTALRTAHQPPILPMAKAGWKAFVEVPGNCPPEMDGSTEGKLLPDLEAVLNKLGERVTSELIWLWKKNRTMPLEGYRGNRWKLFLDEALKEKLIVQAKENAKREKSSKQMWWEENTAEGRAAFARYEEMQQEAAMEAMRKIHKETFGAVKHDEETSIEETRRFIRETTSK
jgi:hypothetical protein